MTATTGSSRLRSPRNVAAAWWLETATELAKKIDDADAPVSVAPAHNDTAYLTGRPGRPAYRSRRELRIPLHAYREMAGTDEGRWLVAHALSAGRWPRRQSRPGTPAGLALGLAACLAAGQSTTAAAPGLWWAVAASLAVVALVVTVLRRRRRMSIMQTSDRRATDLVGVEAAGVVLGPDPDEVYQTVVHAYIARHDPLRTHARLARLHATSRSTLTGSDRA